jgi:hypothetical protein
VLEAIEAYDRLGKTAPAALNQIYVLTASLPEATGGESRTSSRISGMRPRWRIPKLVRPAKAY